MRTLAIDSSTVNSGWSLIDWDEEKHKVLGYKYGNIQPIGKMCLNQRIYYLGNEIAKIIKDYEPDEIALEETIMVSLNGFKTARELARASGAIIYHCYAYQKKPIYFYEPLKWRHMCGMHSKVHKAEIQFHVCKTFNLLTGKQTQEYRERMDEINRILYESREIPEQRELEKIIARKKTSDEERKACKKELDRLKKEKNARVKSQKKYWDKAMQAVAVDIYSDTGLNTDVTDSFAINFALLNDLGWKIWEK